MPLNLELFAESSATSIVPASISAGVTSVTGSLDTGFRSISPDTNLNVTTTVSGGLGSGPIILAPATITSTITVSNKAPDVLVSVSVFGALANQPVVPLVPGTISFTATVGGSIVIPAQGSPGAWPSDWSRDWPTKFHQTAGVF